MPAIQIKGIEALERKLGADLRPTMRTAARDIALAIAGVMKKYPPATAANRPGRWYHPKEGTPRPMGYYERGRGYWYPIMSRANLASGSFGHYGKAFGRIKAPVKVRGSIAGYKLGSHSERLQSRWDVQGTPNGARVFNPTSYGGYVQNALKQSAVMKAIGWRTDKDAIEQVVSDGTVGGILKQAIQSHWK